MRALFKMQAFFALRKHICPRYACGIYVRLAPTVNFKPLRNNFTFLQNLQIKSARTLQNASIFRFARILFVCKHTSLRYFTGVRVPQQAPIENKTNTLCNYANGVRFIYTKNNEGQAPSIVSQCDALHHDTSSEVDADATTRGSESLNRRHKRNVFCLPRQRAFLLAFQAKNGQKQAFSGSNAVNRLQRSPIFCYQNAKTVENAGILFAFLCSAKNTKKVRVGRI